MTLCNSVVKRREAFVVCRVQGAPVLKQERDHGDGADGGGAMNRVLTAAVADAS